jgi:hypothetical protein
MSNPNTQIQNKVNQLAALWPSGTVAPSKWLLAQGYSQEQLTYYARTGWLQRVGQGAYVHPKAEPRHWAQVLYSLQHALNLDVHVGGQTILDDAGFGPNVQDRGVGKVRLYGSAKLAPRWLEKLTQFDFKYRVLKGTGLKPLKQLSTRDYDGLEVRVANLELAFLELLYDVPKLVNFDLARQYAEPLSVLRPEVMQALLETSTVAKVNRLALYFGSAFKLSWFAGLRLDRIYVGKGHRQLVKGGKLDPFTGITIPQGFPLAGPKEGRDAQQIIP